MAPAPRMDSPATTYSQRRSASRACVWAVMPDVTSRITVATAPLSRVAGNDSSSAVRPSSDSSVVSASASSASAVVQRCNGLGRRGTCERNAVEQAMLAQLEAQRRREVFEQLRALEAVGRVRRHLTQAREFLVIRPRITPPIDLPLQLRLLRRDGQDQVHTHRSECNPDDAGDPRPRHTALGAGCHVGLQVRCLGRIYQGACLLHWANKQSQQAAGSFASLRRIREHLGSSAKGGRGRSHSPLPVAIPARRNPSSYPAPPKFPSSIPTLLVGSYIRPATGSPSGTGAPD